ncbi:DNA alkylation repair protein [Myroides profundi]|uniref:3-methyladenine DNA glycosylase AlkD n=1 Tax=Myroides profundi TaxID=480520 RepID=A0AAJ4W6K6_MYRPR|nr:DNA alkylation repair protein [Myroides profundi]AJH15573.1 3-methyladenine DNA glycosylase AlkD [Myroides profundi]SER52377.1 3-methyladenine DNA glycosylase AlkD [Myroides profundi]
MKELLSDIRQTLQDYVDPQNIVVSSRFFKGDEQPKEYGVSKEILNKIGKELFNDLKTKPKEEIYSLCQELWKSLYFEEAYIACIITKRLHRHYEATDMKYFGLWLNKYVQSWADCDTLCCSTIGPLFIKYPLEIEQLTLWATSPNRWMRRGAAVSLVVPARKGLYLEKVFELAILLMKDEDDLVQKGTGWMLKEASKSHQAEVYEFIMQYKVVMSRTTLRYAIEKMPLDLKAEAMKK